MVKLTRNGIAYDLTKTPHTIEILYPDNKTKVQFCFSSQLCLNKFNDKFMQHREKIKESLSNRFGLVVENNLLSDLVLYSKCESRGFFLRINDNEEYKCLSSIRLDGKNQTY